MLEAVPCVAAERATNWGSTEGAAGAESPRLVAMLAAFEARCPRKAARLVAGRRAEAAVSSAESL